MLWIIIVTWNSARFIRDCLASIPPGHHPGTVIIDNHSTDATVEVIQAEFPAVQLIVNQQNTGYAHANNQALELLSSSVAHPVGVRRCSSVVPNPESGGITTKAPRHQGESGVGGSKLASEVGVRRCSSVVPNPSPESAPVSCLLPTVYLLLNPDTQPPPDGITQMLDYLAAHSDIAVLAPKLVNSDGTPQRSVRRFPTYGNLLRALLGLRSDYRLPDFDYTRTQDVEQPMASCLLIRQEVIEQVGVFDEQFPYFMNDVDLLKRIHDADLRIVYYPEVAVWHYTGGSTEQARVKMVWSTHQSLFRYFRKHDRSGWFWLKAIPLALAIETAALLRVLAAALKPRRKAQAQAPSAS